MKIFDYEEVKMNWDSFTYPIAVGTPVSIDGGLADNASAHGLIARTVFAKPDADETLKVMTGGIIDMEEIVAGYGQELSSAAVQALCGIHFYKDGVCIPTGGSGGGVTPEIEAEIENAQWKTEGTEQLFSETVNTIDEGSFFGAPLVYSQPITADQLIVTFNGVEYICPAQPQGGGLIIYGAPYDPDTGKYNFDDIPFGIESGEDGSNALIAETVGTYTVSASTEAIIYTNTFKEAVRKCALKEVKTLQEADIVVVDVLQTITADKPNLTVSIYKDINNEIAIDTGSRPSSIQPGKYYFWRVSDLYFRGYNLILSETSNVLYAHLNSDAELISNGLIVTKGVDYALSSNTNLKFYSIGLTALSGDSGGSPK